ncbi:hypothetical protein Taro_051772 [Colocasia esculenta]|uniref:EF-hand domain-containing protein n=1 Tax=Colocasia esculenta TaxID=4460 RepID=A0A843XGS5_COLES|nr:hypothetical protein [Colocasia esculenta]
MVAVLRSLVHLLAEFRHCCMKTVLFFSTVLLRVGPAAVAGAYFSGKEEKWRGTGVAGRACKSCKKTPHDLPVEPDGGSGGVDMIKIVMDRLGLWVTSEEEDDQNWVGGECGECRLVGAVSCLLEEKEASLEELGEAFSVFDQNGDGFITPVELGRVLQALGFGEGCVVFQDCVLMIRAFDEDGDGRICLSEFKNMLQKAR